MLDHEEKFILRRRHQQLVLKSRTVAELIREVPWWNPWKRWRLEKELRAIVSEATEIFTVYMAHDSRVFFGWLERL